MPAPAWRTGPRRALAAAAAPAKPAASPPAPPSAAGTREADGIALLREATGLPERNELLSRLGNSGPGRLNLSVPFVGQLSMYVALPAASVIASVFQK